MFDFFQKHKRFSQILLGAIALTFVTWGIESYTTMRGASDMVASVNGIEVSQREFQDELQRQQDQLRRMFGRNLDPAVLDTPESRQALLDGIIAQKLVAYRATRANLVVTDELLVETIHSIPAFQSNGRFDKAQYELALSSQNPPMSPAMFEARLRTDLAMQQLTSAVGGTGIAPRSVAGRLAALEAQSYPHLDVIAVDNGSRDGSREVLRGFSARFLPGRVVTLPSPLPSSITVVLVSRSFRSSPSASFQRIGPSAILSVRSETMTLRLSDSPEKISDQ